MIVVTGCSRGIGRAIASTLVARGKEVLGISRANVDAKFRSVSCDVADYGALKELAGELRREGARIEALINVAGVASMNLALTTPENTVRKVIDVNLLGTIFSCQLFTPLMIRAKGNAIINFSTIAVALGLKGESVYVASKAGVEGFSRAFAREVSDFGITVNCVAPGPIDTDLIRGVRRNQIDNIINQQIVQRQYDTDAVCNIVDFLLSEKATSVTGQVIHIGGV